MNEISTVGFNLSEVQRVAEPSYRDKLAEHEPSSLSLIKRGGETVGWLQLDIPDNVLYSCFIFIYITPQLRRRGIAAEVYREAEVKMKASGCNWWSSYQPLDAADKFAMAVGFDYTNTNYCMRYDGGLIGMPHDGIRGYEERDFPAAPELWSREYGEMHRRIGLPCEFKEKTDEERENCRREYIENRSRNFVLDIGGKIIGLGALFSDDSGIGALAVDNAYSGHGYGTRLAAFITDECIRRGCKQPTLYCEAGNDNALHIYEKLGYKEISRESVAIKNQGNTA